MAVFLAPAVMATALANRPEPVVVGVYYRFF
jgi:hypothetical protein